MRKFVFRNYTVEYLFDKNVQFSGYNNSFEYDENADTYFWFYLYPIKESVEGIIEEIESYTNQLEIFLSRLAKNKKVLLFTITDLLSFQQENSDYRLTKAISDYNLTMYNYAKENRKISIVDLNSFFANYEKCKLINWKFYYLSQMVINPLLVKSFKKWLNLKIDAINFKRKKCLILDLDNTLWGGILGEDGVVGIKLGNSYPGNIYSEFQRNILEAAKKGVILAVCSKNNENDVYNAWDNNPEMILKQEHFSVIKINWNNKAENINQIAKDLNIGLDSLVFIDDNPVERELVKSMLPEVAVPDFPDKVYDLNVFFRNVYDQYFQIYQLTDEDKSKTKQYKLNAKRNILRKNTLNVDDYLKQLQTEITIDQANDFNIARIAQMTQKTNQFNLTTRRYTDSDICTFIDDGGLVLCLSTKDKFGDNGITGTSIINLQENEAVIDSLLLSCRVLGRNIEFAFVNKIINILREKGIVKVYAEYIPSLKNMQVECFYEKLGFDVISDNGSKKYLMKINKGKELDDNIKVIYNEK